MNLVSKLRTVLDPIDMEFQSKDNLHIAAVLIPIFLKDEKVFFTKRTELVKHHKGQISFPGGRFEDNDENLITTALRETNEEVGIKPEAIEILGKLNPDTTISHHHVHPYVGIIADDVEIKLNPNEVAECFFVPLSKLLEKDTLKQGDFEGVSRSYYSVKEYKIWGITAGFLSDLLTRLKSI